ncbi:DUF4429 domain-containing protein [Nocardiopsis algeriensis]|uniref:Uncharacterized protein n=1 Tax=Nocardiopsis algeriensis TaxID=1478215 RepID=A0A841IPY9_9ACTN|nr:DUF4429 domain-containing protein [Nocardiopsis algeriensis]MBB6120743.1 hypothetical protein [Nocardiopsis algeriensis]
MEELRGHYGTWKFDDEAVRMRFDAGRKAPALLRALSGCTLPLAAVREVSFDPGDRKRGWRLRLHLAEGADPYASVGAYQDDYFTPLLLTGPHDKELVAEYFAQKLESSTAYAREAEGEPAPGAVALALVARPPLLVRTAEGSASFDGTRVRLQWDGWLASTAKGKEKSREYRLADIEAARWYPPVDLSEGYLRIVLRGVSIPEASSRENDFFTLASHGRKGSEETLLMAATLNAHVAGEAAGEPGAEPAALESGPGQGGSEEIFAKIRELGLLHAEGLLTDDEFSAKKAELLARL